MTDNNTYNSSSKNINRFSIMLVVILLIQTAMLFYHMDIKSSLSTDEVYTYSLANSPNGIFFFPKISRKSPALNLWNKWIPGQIFNDYITVTPGNEFNFSNVYDNQTQDTTPPLYYYIIHFICSFFPKSFSKWYGFSLNLIIFISVQLLLYKVSKKLFKSDRYALLSCILYGFSYAALNNFTYISTNSLITFWNLLFLKIVIDCLEQKMSLFLFIEILLVIVLGGLTHYLFLLYSTIVILTYSIIKIKNKNYKQMCSLIGCCLFGYLWVYLLFPSISNQILYSISTQEIMLSIENTIQNIGVLSLFIRKSVAITYPYCFYIGAFLFIAFCAFATKTIIILYLKKFNQEVLFLIIIPIAIIFPIISFGINYYIDEVNPLKYYLSFFPIIAIIFLITLKQLNKTYITSAFIVISVLASVYGTSIALKNTNNNFFNIDSIFKDNNAIFYIPSTENLQMFVPHFSLCRNVLLINYNTIDLNNTDMSKIVLPGKNYLIAPKNTQLNNKYTKVNSFSFSSYEVDIYKITE